jgi:hypothetical protein
MAENVKITISALDKTKKGFGSATKGLKAVAGAVLNAKTAIVGLVGAAGFGLLISRSLQATDTLTKTANKIGTTTEALGALRYAADLTGVSTQTMDMALQRFTRRTAEAAQGTGEAKGAIKELGINAQELNRMPLDERMIVLADAFEGVKSESDRLRLAFKLFDSEGAALVNTLSQGSDGLKEMLGEAKALGLTMSSSAAKGVEDTVDALTKLQSLFKGVTDQTVAAFAPAIEMVVERFTAFLQRSIEAKGGIEAFARSLAIDLLKGIKLAVGGFQELANGFIKVYNGSIQLKNQLQDTFNVGLQSSKEYRADLDKLDKKIEGVKNTTNMSVDAQLAATDKLMERRKKLLNLYHQAQDAEAAGEVGEIDLLSGFVKEIDLAISSLENFKATASTVPAALVPALNDIELGFKSWSDSIPDMTTNVQNLTKQGLDGLTDSLTAGITGAANFADAMKSMAKSVVDSLIKMLVQKYIVDAAFGFITTKIAGFGQSTSNMEGHADFVGPMLPKALGGPVQGKSPYLVGERGPELFIPNSNGSIIPNNQMGGGGDVVVNQTINVTTGVQQTVRAEIATLMPQIANAAKGAVADARMRGGGYSKALVGA